MVGPGQAESKSAPQGEFPGLPGWRRSPCLGCAERVVAARHAYVVLGGRRDGTALVIFGQDPDRIRAEDPDALESGELLLLGVAHRGCVERARWRLRAGHVPLPVILPTLAADEIEELPEQFHLPPDGRRCAFCGGDAKLTDEHVWPQWLSRALRQLPGAPKQHRPFVTRAQPERRSRIIDITAPICEGCNNRWLATLEQDAQPVIAPLLALQASVLGRAEQALIAAWAVKTALMFDLSSGSEAIIPLGFYRDFALKRVPSESMRVYIAGYAGPAPASGRRESLWLGDLARQHPPNAFATTLTAGALLLQVAGHFVRSASFHDDRWQFADCTRQLWPPTCDSISWPPGNTVLDHEALEDFATSFGGRGVDEDASHP